MSPEIVTALAPLAAAIFGGGGVAAVYRYRLRSVERRVLAAEKKVAEVEDDAQRLRVMMGEQKAKLDALGGLDDRVYALAQAAASVEATVKFGLGLRDSLETHVDRFERAIARAQPVPIAALPAGGGGGGNGG